VSWFKYKVRLNTLVGNTTTKEEQVPVQVRSLFSKYKNIGSPTVSEYISSIPDNFSEALNILLSPEFSTNFSSTDYTLANRKRLGQYIREFHSQAGILSTAVNDSIALLGDHFSKILVSIHQPNLFAYSGIYKKIILLETLKSIAESKNPNVKLINLFLIVDHDFLDDLWIRMAQLPSIRHRGGIFEIRTLVNKSKRWHMVCNTPPPPRSILESWRKQIKLWIKNASTNKFDKSILLRNFDEFWAVVEEAYSRSKTYADFNAFFLSKVVSGIWGYKTLFVRLSDISPVFEKGYEFLLSHYNTYSGAVEKAENFFLHRNIDTGVSSTAYLNAPVWIHCKCGSKASAKVSKENQDFLVRGKCMSCKNDLQIEFKDARQFKLSEEAIHKISPRAIPILLLLSRELGIGCYASGTGGSTGYSILGSLIFKELSIKMPLTVAWPSEDVYVGLGQSEALEHLQLKQVDDVLDYMQKLRLEDSVRSAKIRPLLIKRDKLIRQGNSIDRTLSELILLKEEQRKIHRMIKVVEKAKNCLHVKPCMIDYGVNFGLKSVEKLWRQNLIRNDNLMLPAVLSSRD
jgi:hypothetical protein